MSVVGGGNSQLTACLMQIHLASATYCGPALMNWRSFDKMLHGKDTTKGRHASLRLWQLTHGQVLAMERLVKRATRPSVRMQLLCRARLRGLMIGLFTPLLQSPDLADGDEVGLGSNACCAEPRQLPEHLPQHLRRPAWPPSPAFRAQDLLDPQCLLPPLQGHLMTQPMGLPPPAVPSAEVPSGSRHAANQS